MNDPLPEMPPARLDGGDGLPFPQQVAVLPVAEPVVFPHMITPLVIREDSEKQIVDDVLKGERLIGVFPTALDAPAEANDLPAIRRPITEVGTLCAVIRMLKIPDGTMRLLVHGVARIAIGGMVQETPYRIARITRFAEEEHADDEVEALKKQTLETLQRAIELTNMPEDVAVAAMNVDDAGKLADLVASHLTLKPDQLRAILAERNTKTRLRLVYTLLSREVHVLEIGHNISEKVRQSVDKNQREFFLREQIRTLQSELGENDPHEQELRELRDRLEKKTLPPHAKKVAEREMGRLALLQPAAAEYSVIRTYLEWILDLPWAEKSDDRIDLIKAARILDEDHYGLEKIKERILEFLAVIRLKSGDLKGPILCLVGPPGVGKTSLGKSIARATGRKFTRFSLGGMRDEAEIRGHRRTYIGAMPGRIIKSLKDCQTINPLVMLDEVDKLGSDFRGDPASALLEVLDPEQNDSFTDHYMDMPVDLSKVMFITTANSLDTIPGPLRDRMEIIRIAGYTPTEKVEIARRYLVPREIDNAGLKKSQLKFAPAALRTIVDEYTLEAGVRTLQKQVASIARKVARTVAEQQSRDDEAAAANGSKPKGKKPRATATKVPPVFVKPDDLDRYLGNQRNHSDAAERLARPGVAIGLAWTPVGGEILFIEASRYAGKGDLRLTGQLGDVMKESATAALTFLRANKDLLGVDDDAFAKFDFHLHVPAGATPKDGPSAGVALATALASLVTGRRVLDFLAMTGEISLRGNVLPVGGIKEKCLAAHRAGIKQIFLPAKNKRDLDDIPAPIRDAIEFKLIDRVETALELALRSAEKNNGAKAATPSPRPAKPRVGSGRNA